MGLLNTAMDTGGDHPPSRAVSRSPKGPQDPAPPQGSVLGLGRAPVFA